MAIEHDSAAAGEPLTDLATWRRPVVSLLVLLAIAIVAFLCGQAFSRIDTSFVRLDIALAIVTAASMLAAQSRRATGVLKASEARYRGIFQSMGIAVWEEDLSGIDTYVQSLRRNGIEDIRTYFETHPDAVGDCFSLIRVVSVNESAIRLSKSTGAEALSSLKPVFLPETLLSFRAFILAYIDRAPSFTMETVIRNALGETLHVLMTATFPETGHSHNHVLVAITDITESRRLDAQLQQARSELAHASRIVTLGEISASIAHEVKQPLTSVVTNGEAALRWLDRPLPELTEARLCLTEMIADGRRAGDVVERIRAMSQKGEPKRDPVSFKAVVLSVEKLLRGDIEARGLDVRISIDDSVPPVLADYVQLQQVLINMVLNAIQAMASTLERRIEITARPTSSNLAVTIRDTGAGMDSQTLRGLFTAFNSTKPDGLGLGLSVCRSIIEAHGGRIWAESELGAGTTFGFTLPLAR